jgi:hypothetical protein
MDPALQLYTSIALVLGVIGSGMGVWYVVFRTKAEHLSKRQGATGYTVAAGDRRR